jgi:hypothetical protein
VLRLSSLETKREGGTNKRADRALERAVIHWTTRKLIRGTSKTRGTETANWFDGIDRSIASANYGAIASFYKAHDAAIVKQHCSCYSHELQ